MGWDGYGPTRRAGPPLLFALCHLGLVRHRWEGHSESVLEGWRRKIHRGRLPVKVKCKGRHRENPVIDLFATILGFELF